MMSADEIEQKTTLSRQAVARWLADLAAAIERGGTLELALAGPPVTLTLPEEFRCELEVEPQGDEIELEIELTWSASDTSPNPPFARTRP
ncbi:MAG TPA: amphi-Trp domain-containing protein [Actinomycetospora sp.]|jgi:amphi-Trp domain-containing protein|uniref:amphi-Trp domain-containing protein n=1 Tax=Actinomycetospora sp. TaxID=1872135 RepID=UPI002F3E7107